MKRADFTRRWITHMLSGIHETVDHETRAFLMESCGRACASCGAVGSAEACRGDLDRFLATLRGWVGKDNVELEGDTVHVRYDRCHCQLDVDIPESLSETYCECSRGWLMELFETVLGPGVEVEIVSSIKRGAEKCAFRVRLPSGREAPLGPRG